MLTIAVFAAVVQLASSCCGPAQWEGYKIYEVYMEKYRSMVQAERVNSGIDLRFTVLASRPVGLTEKLYKSQYRNSQGLLNISVDANINKVVVRGYSMWNGQQIKQHIINDYSAGKIYTVYDGKCVTADLPPYPAPGKLNCVPSDAKLVLSTFYGIGDNKYEIDIYEFMVEGTKMQLSFTKGSCVPVGGQQQLTNGFADVGLIGLTEGIKDLSVFNIPSECNKDRTVSPRMQYIKQTGRV